MSRQAVLVRRYGAAVVVMAFDEEGQADTVERKVAICQRAYRILTDDGRACPEDIIFDPNIFAVATGIEAHNDYGRAFIEATREIKRPAAGVNVSGGVSNLSFSFPRQQSRCARPCTRSSSTTPSRAGLDMAIVNAGRLPVYEDIPTICASASRTCIFNRRPDATERLIEVAPTPSRRQPAQAEDDLTWRERRWRERLVHALVHGIDEFVVEDAEEARLALPTAPWT